jgi:hypothetical protein
MLAQGRGGGNDEGWDMEGERFGEKERRRKKEKNVLHKSKMGL